MRTLSILLCAAALVGGRRADAQQAPSFKPIEFVVGSCWVGTFPDGKQTDEHCFDWAYGRKFIRDHHVVRGGAPYEGETLYAWNPVERQVVFTYWSSDGLHGHRQRRRDTTDGAVFPQTLSDGEGDPGDADDVDAHGRGRFSRPGDPARGRYLEDAVDDELRPQAGGGCCQPLATNPAHPRSAPRAST